jgi:hypothetical protein
MDLFNALGPKNSKRFSEMQANGEPEYLLYIMDV